MHIYTDSLTTINTWGPQNDDSVIPGSLLKHVFRCPSLNVVTERKKSQKNLISFSYFCHGRWASDCCSDHLITVIVYRPIYRIAPHWPDFSM